MLVIAQPIVDGNTVAIVLLHNTQKRLCLENEYDIHGSSTYEVQYI